MTSPGGSIDDRMSLSDFRAQEPSAPPDEIWQLIDGSLFKHARADTLAHNEIVSNIVSILGAGLRSRDPTWRVYRETVRVVNDRDDLAVYPDIAVRCGQRRLDQTEITDPIVLVEVLSRSTAEKDRYDKAEAYFGLPTVTHYLVVAQDQMDVTVLERGEADWVRRRFHEPGDRIDIEPLGLAFTLAEIYEGVPEVAGRDVGFAD